MENRNKYMANIKIISDFDSSETEIENAKNDCLYILTNCNYKFEKQAEIESAKETRIKLLAKLIELRKNGEKMEVQKLAATLLQFGSSNITN